MEKYEPLKLYKIIFQDLTSKQLYHLTYSLSIENVLNGREACYRPRCVKIFFGNIIFPDKYLVENRRLKGICFDTK